MAIFTQSPLNGFYGVLGSISVQLALWLTNLFWISPAAESFDGYSVEVNA
jgi:hypothetical protein